MNIQDIINEEINSFDFLGNDESNREVEENLLINKIEFQKQFIIDALLNPNKLIIDHKDTCNGIITNNKIEFEYNLTFEYKYDDNKDPITIDVKWYCDGMLLENFKWNKINVTLNDNINFVSYDNAPDKIKSIFNKEFLYQFVKSISESNNKSVVIN